MAEASAAERPLILVSCDDGIASVGLRVAAEAVAPLGEVLVVAPLAQQTGMGRSFPRLGSEGVVEALALPLGDGETAAHAVHGSPAQAVAHGVLELAPRRPDLCVCGVNDGENLGATCLVSGTVGAALEAAGHGIPSLAVSLASEAFERFAGPYRPDDWTVVADLVRRFAGVLLRGDLPAELALLNLNVPADATTATEVRWTRQDHRDHWACVRPARRDLSRPFRLPVAEAVDPATLEPDTDLYAFLVDRVVSITPMGRDLTLREPPPAVLGRRLGPTEETLHARD